LLDQSSVIRFVEDNWLAGERIQTGGSYDSIAGSIENMFTFAATSPDVVQRGPRTLMLDPETGAKPGTVAKAGKP
jgi:hypothetical protein